MLKEGYTFGGWLSRAINKNLGDDLPKSDLMHQALVESMSSVGISNPNPPVGCVIKCGNDICRGHTQEFRSFHAETMAFKALKDSAGPIEVYVTLEPCTHFGNQPPCVDHFRSRKVSKTHIGTQDPNPKVAGLGLETLKDLKIPIQVGELESEIRAWLFPFLFHQTFQRPLIIGKWAESVEGSLADVQGNSKWISGEMSRSYTHWLRKKYDLIVVGANTYLLDQPELTARNCFSPNSAQPLRVVFDPRGKLSDENFSNLDPKNPWVVISPNSFSIAEGLKSIFWQKGEYSGKRLVEVLTGSKISQIINRPVQSVFVEGGAKLLSLLLSDECLDLLHIFKSKKSIGPSPHQVSVPKSFKVVQTMDLESDTLCEMVSEKGFQLLRANAMAIR